MSEPVVDVDLSDGTGAKVKRKRRRVNESKVPTVRRDARRDWRSQRRYAKWLETPPPEYVREVAQMNCVLAQIREAARQRGLSHRGSVRWSDLARDVGMNRVLIQRMLRGQQAMPLHVACILAGMLGLKVVMVEDGA